jgi:alpha-glucuronidase
VRILFYSAIVWLAVTANVHAATVAVLGPPSPQSAYAARKLEDVLGGSADRFSVTLKILPKALEPEAFSIARRGKTIAITGGDARGLIYGALALREQLLNGTPIDKVSPVREQPALPFRGISSSGRRGST